MDPRKLNRMFDQLTPTAEQEEMLLDRLLRKERMTFHMKRVKQLTAIAAAAALMIISCAAAVITGLDQRLLDYFGAGPEQVELLAPGAQTPDITVINNGATLKVSQVLMDRYNIMLLADFTAPEGTVLDMDEERDGINRGFGGLDWSMPELLDRAGKRITFESGSWQTSVLDDGNALDNHLTLLMCLELSEGIQSDWYIHSLSLPAKDLVRYDPEQMKYITVYAGDWSCQIPVTWQDMGKSIYPDLVFGQENDADIRVTEVYLSPMSLCLRLQREAPIPLHSEQASGGRYRQWISVLNSDDITLTTKDGQTVPLIDLGRLSDDQTQYCSFRLGEITSLAHFQTLTLKIGTESVDISLDNLIAEN